MAQKLDTRIRPEVSHVLSRLRSGIRQFVLIEGVALLIVVTSLLFWISFSVDGLWFELTKYELAPWFRMVFDFTAVLLIGVAAFYWIVSRLVRNFTTKPLALVLERRFPDLNDRLVTSVEVAESISGSESDLTVSMLNRTIESASEEARRINVSDVFDTRPVKWAAIGAAAAIILFGGYAAAFPDDIQRWIGAYVSLEEEYWDRDTRLEVRVIDELTNQPRDFDEDRRFKHPKGGDLTLEISVPEKDARGKALVVPKQVELQYRPQEGGSTKTIPATKSGERKFRVSLKVRDDIELYVVGNDFKNRLPYFIDVVDPPQVEKMRLKCFYPEYTGMNSDRAVSNIIDVLGRQVSVPLETKFVLEITTNKPILLARIEFDRFQLRFGWFPRATNNGKRSTDPKAGREFRAELISKGLPGPQTTALHSALGLSATPSLTRNEFRTPIPENIAKVFFRNDGTPGLRLPFIISAQKSLKARKRFDKEFPGLGKPFLMPPDTEVRIYLQDVDEINSINPEQITIHADRDTPPVVEAEKRDIGDAVTSSAFIPIAAMIRDDHGVAGARIEYRYALKGSTTTEGQPWQPWDLENPPKPNDDGSWDKRFDFFTTITERDAEGKEIEKKLPYEYFKVPLIRVPGEDGKLRDLQAGDLLSISVVANDADNLNGPNSRRSAKTFDFRIVSIAELHNILYEKESRLRIDFEKIIGEIEETRKELVDRKIQLSELKRLRGIKPAADKKAAHDGRITNLQSAIRLTARRAQAQLRKNHNETQAVENGFRQIRAELLNNKLFTKTAAIRLDTKIILELYNANKRKGERGNELRGDYELVDLALGRYNTTIDEGLDPEAGVNESLAKTDALLLRLKAVLKEMKELVKFHEAVQKLAKIITDEEELKQFIEKWMADRLLRKE